MRVLHCFLSLFVTLSASILIFSLQSTYHRPRGTIISHPQEIRPSHNISIISPLLPPPTPIIIIESIINNTKVPIYLRKGELITLVNKYFMNRTEELNRRNSLIIIHPNMINELRLLLEPTLESYDLSKGGLIQNQKIKFSPLELTLSDSIETKPLFIVNFRTILFNSAPHLQQNHEYYITLETSLETPQPLLNQYSVSMYGQSQVSYANSGITSTLKTPTIPTNKVARYNLSLTLEGHTTLENVHVHINNLTYDEN